MAPQAKDGGLELNAMMFRLFDAGYAQDQLLSIRKLWTDNYKIDGEKGIYSIKSLIKDMASHAHLMTRQNLFAVSGLEYDTQKQKDAFEKFWTNQIPGKAFEIPEQYHWEKSKKYHEQIDLLSGVESPRRSPTDVVSAKIFEFLNNQMNSAIGPEFDNHVNKFIFHASTPESRRTVEPSEFRITLDFLGRAHEVIWRTVHFLEANLLTGNRSLSFPIMMNDQFEFIERPLIGADKVPSLRTFWDSYEANVNGIREWGVDDLVKAING